MAHTFEDFWLWLADIDHGRGALLEEIRSRHTWLYHRAPISAFDSIAKFGLQRRFPGTSDTMPPAIVLARLGLDMVCFAPSLTAMTMRGDVYFALALHRDSFPTTPGIDWSFPPLVKAMRGPIESASSLEAALKLAAGLMSREGAFAFYDSVVAKQLRVRTVTSDPTNPGDWPELQVVSELELHTSG